MAFLEVHQPRVGAIQDSTVATSACSLKLFRKDRNLHNGGEILLIHKGRVIYYKRGGTFGGGWGRVHLGGSENFGDLLGVGNK